MQLHNYEESLACAKRLKELDPHNASVEPLLVRIRKRIAEYKAREKQMSASMASKLFKTKREEVKKTESFVASEGKSTTDTPATPKPNVAPSHTDETNLVEEYSQKNVDKVSCEPSDEVKQTDTMLASSKKDSTPTWQYLFAIAVLLAINTLLVLALIYH